MFAPSSPSARLAALLACCCLFGPLASAAELPKRDNNQLGNNFDISSLDMSNVDDENNSNMLLKYEPIEPRKPVDYKTQSTQRNAANQPNNKLKSSSYTEEVRPVLEAGSEPQGSANVERIKDIALNSREVRLVGPNQKEVEMKDDVASKIVVAMENLQKEASGVWGQVNERLDKSWTELKRSEVWGQVNEKLDKGWTDLKTMVEGVVAPASKKP